jgi:photosystem II stability/assembly factor-like uncharacterized protein
MGEAIRLYTGTSDGLIGWRAEGDGFAQVCHEFKGHFVDALAATRERPERVFVGISKAGLSRTEDGGLHWQQVFTGDVRAVAIDPADDRAIYVGTEPVGLYRSENCGEHWTELSGLQDLPDSVKANWWFPQPPHTGHIRHIFIHPQDSRILYLCIEHGGVVRSADGGVTWEDVSEGIDYVDMHYLSNQPGSFERYYTASARGFFRSDDPSRGWQRAENGFTRDYFHNLLFLAGEPTVMLAATADQSPGHWARPGRAKAAIFRSLDGADSWHQVGEGLPDSLEPMVWALAPHPHDRHAVLAGLGDVARNNRWKWGGGDVYLSRDRGDSWQRLPIELPPVRGLVATAAD